MKPCKPPIGYAAMDDIKMHDDGGSIQDALPAVTNQPDTTSQIITLPVHGGPPTSLERNSHKMPVEMAAPQPHNKPLQQRSKFLYSSDADLSYPHRTRRLRKLINRRTNTVTRLSKRARAGLPSAVLTKQNAEAFLKRADLFLEASQREFCLPRLPPIDSTSFTQVNINGSISSTLPVIPCESLYAALAAPTAGLLLPASKLLGVEILAELSRAVGAFVVAHHMPKPQSQDDIKSTLRRYLSTSLTLLHRYMSCKFHTNIFARGEEDWRKAVAHLDEDMAGKWLQSQSRLSLEAKVTELLHAQGHDLGANAQRQLLQIVEPTAIWPELHRDVYAYMDRYRQLMGIVGIKPDTLQAVIDYLAAARSKYIANIDDESPKSDSRMRGLKSESGAPRPLCTQPTNTYRDTNDIEMAEDSAEDEEMNDTASSTVIDNSTSPILQPGEADFLKALDKWIAVTKFEERKSKENEMKLDPESMVALRLTDSPRRPMKNGLRQMLEARGIKKFKRRQK